MRRDAITRIARVLNAVVSRRTSVTVGLWGEPGVGKTHTTQAILGAVACRSVSLHATSSIVALTTALTTALPPAPLRSRTLPDWARVQLERAQRDETSDIPALARAIAEFLVLSAPLVLHLEDAHEADAKRLEFILALARAVGQTRGVGLLVTSRAALPSPFLNHRLEAMTLMETAALLEGELKAEAPRAGLEWVFERTRGNPLFVLEFTRYLKRQGFLWSDGEGWQWREPPQSFVPITVEALVLEMVARVTTSQPMRDLLETRTLVPLESEFPEALWMFVAEVDAETLATTRAQLEALGVLHGGAFAHPLFREVIHHEIPLVRKRRFARRALEALQDQPDVAIRFVDSADLDNAEARDWFERASATARDRGEPVRAGHYLARAATFARGEGRGRLALEAVRMLGQADLLEATRQAEIAVDLLPNEPEAMSLLGKLLAVQGRLEAAEALLERLSPDERSQPKWLQHRLSCHVAASDTSGALALLRAHPALLESDDPDTAYLAAFTLVISTQYATGINLATTALERLELTPFERARLRTVFAFADLYQGRFAQAEVTLRESVLVLREHGDEVALAGTLFNHAITLKSLNHFEEARLGLEEARRLYASAGHVRRQAQVQLQLAALLVSLGRFEAAERVLLESRNHLQWLGPSEQLVDCDFELSRLYASWKPPHGQTLAARHAFDALNAARVLGNPRLLVQPLFAAAEAELWRGDLERALELSDELLKLARQFDHAFGFCAGHTTRGLTLERLGKLGAAVAELRLALPYADLVNQHEITFEIARVNGDLGAARAELEWFEAQGQVFSAQHALETLPALRTDPVPIQTSSQPIIRLNVLGSITLERDGQPVPTRAKKRLELLALLLEARVAGRAEATTLEMIDALHPGEPETDAKNTLKQHVYLLRSSLGADSILSTPNGYALGNVSSDAEEILGGGDPGLWRGAYLGGLIENWYPSVREALTLSLRLSITALVPTDPHLAARLCAILEDMEPYDADALRLRLCTLEATNEQRTARRVFLEGRARLLEVGETVPETMDEFVTGAGVA